MNETKKKDIKIYKEVIWDEMWVQKFCKYLNEIVDFEKCKELEKEIRIETGTGDRMNCHHQDKCINSTKKNFNSTCTNCISNEKGNLMTYGFKKDEDDIIGELMDNEKEVENIKKNIPWIAEKAFIIYSNIIKKAKEERNESINLETDNFIRTDIFKTVYCKFIINSVRRKIKELHCRNNKDITGWANPLNIRDYPLNKITNETMKNLMLNGIAVQTDFVGKTNRELIYKELEFIEFNNQFNEFQKSYETIRTDYYCWTYINNLDRERQKGLYKLLKELALLPFELNKKANLSLQICSLFQFSYFSPNKSFLKKHFQGGYGKFDSGKKITIIYIPFVCPEGHVEIKFFKSKWNGKNKDLSDKEHTDNKQKQEKEEKEEEKVEKEEKEEEKEKEKEIPIKILKPQSDSLILMQTRNVTYEISKSKNKFFVINFWISGPVAPDNSL